MSKITPRLSTSAACRGLLRRPSAAWQGVWGTRSGCPCLTRCPASTWPASACSRCWQGPASSPPASALQRWRTPRPCSSRRCAPLRSAPRPEQDLWRPSLLSGILSRQSQSGPSCRAAQQDACGHMVQSPWQGVGVLTGGREQCEGPGCGCGGAAAPGREQGRRPQLSGGPVCEA